MTSLPRAYWNLSAANLAIEFGRGITAFALPLVAFDLGGTSGAGVVATLVTIGTVGGSFIGGWVSDSFPRKRVLVASSLATAAAMIAAVVVVQQNGFRGQLFVFGLLGSIGSFSAALFGPAELALLKEFLAEDLLRRAVGINQSRFALASMVAPPLGGVLVGVGQHLPFAVDAGIGIFAVTLVALLKVGNPDRCRVPFTMGEVFSGFGVLWKRRDLRSITLIATIVNVVGQALVLSLLLSLRRRGESATLIALVPVAFGCGSLLGGFAVKFFTSRSLRSGLVVSFGLGLVAFVAMGTVNLLFGSNIWVDCLLIVVGMSSLAAGSSLIISGLLRSADDQSAGRVMGAMRTLALIAMPLAPILAVTAIGVVGADAAVVGWCFCLAIPFALVLRIQDSPAD